MYFGAMPFTALYIRSTRSILYVICCLIGSQCSAQRTGVICSELRAAQFCTYCSLSRTNCGKPYRRASQKSNLDETNAS